MCAEAPQCSVTLWRKVFAGLVSFASFVALGLSSATVAVISSLESFTDQGRLGVRKDGYSAVAETRGTRFFQSSQQLYSKRTTIALFEQACMSPMLSVSELPASSFGVKSSSQVCSFWSFADYLNELSSKAFSIPASGVFTSGFGPRWSRHHSGIDIANNVGTAIRASRRGRVVFADSLGAYGLMVEIQHPDGFKTRYAHCHELLVAVGESVAQGDVIARMGNTGRSTGPHLHFEIRSPKGVAIDPVSLLGDMTIQQQV